MNEQKTTLLGHELWVGQKVDGKWGCWILGDRPMQHQQHFPKIEDAKKMVHHLAHWHLEQKNYCDCPGELTWIPASP